MTEDLFIDEWNVSTEHITTSFRSLLVPIDFSRVGDRALATANALASGSSVRVHLVTTLSPGIDPSRDEGDLLARAVRLGVDQTELHILETDEDVAAALGATLEQLPSPLLCIASRGRTAVGDMIFASTTDQLLRRDRSPMLVVGPEADPGHVPETLCVCVDPAGAPRSLLSVARTWQRTFGGHIELVEVIQPARTSTPEPPSELVRAANSLRAPMRTIASHDPAQALIEHAIDHDALLALATHARHGLARVVLGSVAWEVIQRSPTPVLVAPALAARE